MISDGVPISDGDCNIIHNDEHTHGEHVTDMTNEMHGSECANTNEEEEEETAEVRQTLPLRRANRGALSNKWTRGFLLQSHNKLGTDLFLASASTAWPIRWRS